MEAGNTTRHVPEFRGNATEYFGIWIVNLVLTVLTLGIYSAWAKVRTERYMYSNTRLAGASFEYLADPIKILKGRLIAYGVLMVVALSAKLGQIWVVVVFYLVLLALYPYLIHLSVRFRARYSAWRGLRFRFTATPGDAYTAFMLYPIVSFITMNLLMPWMVREQQSYLVKNHVFGGKRFEFGGNLGAYYIPFLIVMGVGFALMMVMLVGFFGLAVGGAAMGGGATPADGTPQLPAIVSVLLVVFFVVAYGGMLALGVYLRTTFLNLRWNNSSLGEHRFASTLDWRRMVWLYLSNGLAILVSIGLAVPWAQVRMLRYRLACTTLIAHGSLDDFVAGAEAAQSAAGAELAHALDLDLDIAL